MGTVVADAGYALRVLRRTPVFTAIAIFVIALGSGAVTTIFSAMNAIVLRPLPGTTDAERLVGIDRRTTDDAEGISASYEYWDFLRHNSRSLAGVGAWSKATFILSSGGEAVSRLRQPRQRELLLPARRAPGARALLPAGRGRDTDDASGDRHLACALEHALRRR